MLKNLRSSGYINKQGVEHAKGILSLVRIILSILTAKFCFSFTTLILKYWGGAIGESSTENTY